MRLTAINGSPRGVTSNTNLLLQHFLEGFHETAGQSHDLIHLQLEAGVSDAVAAFGGAETVLLGFPLYTDAMPAVVKELIEALAPYRGRLGNPALLFLVQSGFPEGSHTRHLVPFLEKLSRRLGCPYLGTMRRGGVEGIRVQPGFMTRSLFGQLRALGRGFGATGLLDRPRLDKLAGPDKLSRLGLYATEKMSEHLFWNPALKKNGAFPLRLAKPYSTISA